MRPYFEVLSVPGLHQISAEIASKLDVLIPDRRFKRLGYGFNRVMPGALLEASPSLRGYLDHVGLLYALGPSALPWAEPGVSGLIHQDVHWSEGINLPVIGQGYGAWYDAQPLDKVKSSRVGSADTSRQQGAYVPCNVNGAKELARVSNDLAFWANTTIPHNGVNSGSTPRVILSLRFEVPLNPQEINAKVAQ